MNLLPTDVQYVYNLCTKCLARDSTEPRHSYFGALDASRSRFCEGWRFPFVDSFFDADEPDAIVLWNRVTFIYRLEDPSQPPNQVAVAGSFAPQFQPIPLERIEDSRYWSVTLQVPTGFVFDYLFVVDGNIIVDPVNTKLRRDDAGNEWSFFWTNYCRQLVTFELWESVLLQRLTDHIMPFNTREARNFLNRLDPAKAGGSRFNLYRFDQSVGVVNYIDKLLAGEEQHQRYAYKTCLSLINKVLRKRNPYQEPRDIDEQFYVDVYNDLADRTIQPWDENRYQDPSYFLKLLRRHTMMGAFSHPKYGGNVGGFAWAYLAERFRDPNGQDIFDWRQALESPLGTSRAYLG